MPATTRTTPRKYSWLANQPIQRKIQLAIVLLLGVSLAANLLTLNSLRQEDAARHWYVHTYAVLQQIDEIRHAARTAQVGIRGYLLDQRADERNAYATSMRRFDGLTRRLRALTADNPLQLVRIDQLENLVAQWRQEVDGGVFAPLAKLGALDPARQPAERLRIQSDYLGRRFVPVADILTLLDQMTSTEQDLLAGRTARVDSLMTRTRAIDTAFALLVLLLGGLVISLCFRLITRPLRRITDQMNRLAAHDHEVEIRQVERRDEIGEIARALQVFKEMAIETHDNTRLKSQVAAISQQLQEATSHRAFAERLTGELMPLLGAGLGLLYLHDEPSGRLDLIGSYGLRLGADPAVRYLPGEGLVGQCAQSRRPIELDRLPDDYLRIDSGSGSALPRHLLILPVLLRDRLIGVLEFAGFAAPTALQRQLLEQLLPTVALSLDNLGRAVRTQDLLEQTQEQADQLRVSSITMRQQQEALRESHDILQAKTLELEEQSQRLLVSEEELRVQAEELQASNEELRLQSDTLHEQKRALEALQAETAEKAHEPVLRVPLSVAGPGIPHGVRYDAITTVDLTSTVLDLAGARPLPAMDGRSLAAEMTGPDQDWTVPVVTEGLIKDVRRRKGTDLPPGLTTSGLRTPRYKLIRYANGDAELYDLLLDPNELTSVWNDPAYASIRQQLTDLWEQYKQCRGAGCRVPLPPSLWGHAADMAAQDANAHREERDYYDR